MILLCITNYKGYLPYRSLLIFIKNICIQYYFSLTRKHCTKIKMVNNLKNKILFTIIHIIDTINIIDIVNDYYLFNWNRNIGKKIQ